MEEKNTKEHPEGCKCGMCQGNSETMHQFSCCGGKRHHFFLLKFFIGMAILLAVFLVGIKLGEIKNLFHGEYGAFGRHGYSMMSGKNNYQTMCNKILNQYGNSAKQSTTTPETAQ